jgi:hypothetical protein
MVFVELLGGLNVNHQTPSSNAPSSTKRGWLSTLTGPIRLSDTIINPAMADETIQWGPNHAETSRAADPGE